MGEYRDGKWCPTFGDVQAGIADEAPGEVRFDTERALRKQLKMQADEIERLRTALDEIEKRDCPISCDNIAREALRDD